MGRRVLIPDDDEFPRLWGGPLTIKEIGWRYGVSAKVVSAKARRDGLPAREKFRSAVRQKAIAAQARKDRLRDNRPVETQLDRLVKARARGVIPTPPFWTAERDHRVVKTAGCYADMRALASKWSVPMSRVIARWHVVRRV